eukprot:4461254-Amphidinium_carterae.1
MSVPKPDGAGFQRVPEPPTLKCATDPCGCCSALRFACQCAGHICSAWHDHTCATKVAQEVGGAGHTLG